MPQEVEIFKYPTVSDGVQAVIDYVETLDEFPSITTVAGWIQGGLPSEIVENIALKETNAALEAAVLELAELIGGELNG